MDDGAGGGVPVEGLASPGGGYLGLLADPRKLALMLSLRVMVLAGATLARGVGLSERRVREHMRVLSERGLAVRVQIPCRSHRVGWRLTEAGCELLRLHDLIVGCEQRLRCASSASRSLVEILGYAHVRAIVWALTVGALTLAEIEHRLEWISHSTIEWNLGHLCESGLVLSRGAGIGRRYELARRARGPLGLIAVSGVRWRLLFTPDQPPPRADNLLGLMMLLEPVARVTADVRGICLMQVLPDSVEGDPVRWPDAYVSVRRGRISPLPTGSLQAPRARMRASDLDWCEALLGGDFERIEIEGDRELALAPLGALAAALRIPAAPSAARRRPRATV